MAVPRETLVREMSKLIEALVELAPVIDAMGSVGMALKTEPGCWDYLSDNVIAVLAEGYGIKQPPQ